MRTGVTLDQASFSKVTTTESIGSFIDITGMRNTNFTNANAVITIIDTDMTGSDFRGSTSINFSGSLGAPPRKTSIKTPS